MPKLYTLLTGLFFIAYGLIGVIKPDWIAIWMGWEPKGTFGHHQIRTTWMVTGLMGLVILFYRNKLADQTPLILPITLVMFGFMTGRLISFMIDRGGNLQTYLELGVEGLWALIGWMIIQRAKKAHG